MNNYIYKDGELYHYGVPGMKWGVKRYQNEDGSLTTRGKRRFDRVANSKRAQRRNTKAAISVLKSYKADKDLDAYASDLSAKKLHKKIDKLARKSEASQQLKDQIGLQKYQNKTRKQLAKYEKARQLYERSTQESAVLQKKIDDISNGTLRAGKDFVARNVAIVVPIQGGFIGAHVRDYIEKNSNS